jgi:hypothetical protein
MLALLPLIALLVMLSTVAGIKQEFRAQKPWYDGALTAIGLAWLVWTVIQVVGGWGQLDWSRFALMFYLPLWLTAAALPFVYALGMYSQWEQARTRKRWERRRQRGG